MARFIQRHVMFKRPDHVCSIILADVTLPLSTAVGSLQQARKHHVTRVKSRVSAACTAGVTQDDANEGVGGDDGEEATESIMT